MAVLNRQTGTQRVTRRPPKLAGFVVKGGTWKPSKLTKNEADENEEEEVFGHSFWGPGDQITCQLYQLVTIPPTADLQVSQVIQEIATLENPVPGTWLVMKADPTNFGLRSILFDCTLERHDAEDLTITTPP